MSYNITYSKLRVFLFFLLLIQTSLMAETVILLSHEVLHGKITYQDAKILRMKDETGKPIEIAKNDILKVSYRDVKDVQEIKKIIQEEEKKLPPEKRKKASVEKRNKYLIVGRSAIVPGWGQWETGNKWTGALSFVVVFGAAANATSSFLTFKTAEKTYQNQSVLIFIGSQSIPGVDVTTKLLIGVIYGAQSFEPYSTAQVKGDNALRVLGLVYAAQLIHSYFLGSAWEKADPNTTIEKKPAFGDWNLNAQPRQALSVNGISRETYYEVNYQFRF